MSRPTCPARPATGSGSRLHPAQALAQDEHGRPFSLEGPRQVGREPLGARSRGRGRRTRRRRSRSPAGRGRRPPSRRKPLARTRAGSRSRRRRRAAASREPVLAGRRELGQPVLKPPSPTTASAGDLRQRGLCAERGGPRVAERSRPERVEQAARRERGEVRGGAVGEDRHVPGVTRPAGSDSRIVVRSPELEPGPRVGEAARDRSRSAATRPPACPSGSRAGTRAASPARRVPRVADERRPRPGSSRRSAPGRRRRGRACGARSRQSRVVSAPSSVPTARSTSASSRNAAQRAVVAGRAGGERMILGQSALAHERRRDGDAQPLGERAQLLPGAGREHAAAGPDRRALGPGEQARGLVERRRVRWCDRRGSSVERSHRHARLPFQHVPRHLDVDGPGRRGQRPAPGLREQLRDRLRALGPRGRLDDRARTTRAGRAARAGSRAPCRSARAGSGRRSRPPARGSSPPPSARQARSAPPARSRGGAARAGGSRERSRRRRSRRSARSAARHRGRRSCGAPPTSASAMDPGQPERDLRPERLERLDDDVPTRPAGHCGSLPWLKRRHQRPRKSRVRLGGRAHVRESHPVSRRVRVALVAGAETDGGDAGLARPVDAVRRELPDAGLRRAPERRRRRGEGGARERRVCDPRARAGRRAGARRARAARRRPRDGERSRGAAPARSRHPRRA